MSIAEDKPEDIWQGEGKPQSKIEVRESSENGIREPVKEILKVWVRMNTKIKLLWKKGG